MVHRGPFQRLLLVLLVLAKQDGHASTSRNSLPWENAKEFVHSLCPYNSICGTEKERKTDVFLKSCCADCRCSEECLSDTYNDNCCFLNNTPDDMETCMFPHSGAQGHGWHSQSESLLESYFIVTKTPPDGCVSGGPDLLNSCNVAFFPVTSNEGKIYFNRDCARCHGVNVTTEWDASIVCDFGINPENGAFERELMKFLTNQANSKCFLFFLASGRMKMNIKHRRCDLYDPNVRKDEYHEDGNMKIFNMSLDDIFNACTSNLYSPVYDSKNTRWYKNQFCYLYQKRNVDKDCFQQTYNPSGMEYLMLVNSNVNDVLTSKRVKQSTELACRQEENSTSQSKVCRPLSCQMGQILDKNGHCIFFATSIYYRGRSSYVANLFLRRQENTALSILGNITDNAVIQALGLPDEWDAFMVGVTADKQNYSEILVSITVTTTIIEQAFSSLGDYLNGKESVIFQDGSVDHPFTLNLYPFSAPDLSMYDPRERKHCVELNEDLASNSDLLPAISLCWMIIYTKPRYNQILFSKLYLCKLVELIPKDFKLFANGFVLYNELTSKYLYQKEFLIVENENGNQTAKVCLEDSGLSPSRLDTENGFVKIQSTPIVFIGMLVVTLISLLHC